MSRILIALGGNALGNNYLEQQRLIERAARKLVKLFNGNEVIITHGNGPQVGMITKSLAASNINMPFDCCTAMSEGYIGFHIQRKIRKTLINKKIERDVITVVSEVEVLPTDKSFKKPTKPIGKFYTKEEAEKLASESGDIYVEDAGRGYRKVVASPKPVNILNLNPIEKLVSDGTIVVACGGGGIPVFDDYDNNKVEAVIDKDLASSLLARKLKCDKFIILTAVNQVKINFNKKNEKALERISVSKIEEYMKKNEFKKGSMLPKVKAAIDFVKSTGKEAIITGLSNVDGILKEKDITIIYK